MFILSIGRFRYLARNARVAYLFGQNPNFHVQQYCDSLSQIVTLLNLHHLYCLADKRTKLFFLSFWHLQCFNQTS